MAEIVNDGRCNHALTPMKTQYLFVAVNGCREIQKWISAVTSKDARKAFWASLSDDEKNSTQSIECIDERTT